jgi:hypothetical protein
LVDEHVSHSGKAPAADPLRRMGGRSKNKLMAAAAKVLPETVKAQLHRKMSEPGSVQR